MTPDSTYKFNDLIAFVKSYLGDIVGISGQDIAFGRRVNDRIATLGKKVIIS